LSDPETDGRLARSIAGFAELDVSGQAFRYPVAADGTAALAGPGINIAQLRDAAFSAQSARRGGDESGGLGLPPTTHVDTAEMRRFDRRALNAQARRQKRGDHAQVRDLLQLHR
jgi:hypothetical protein